MASSPSQCRHICNYLLLLLLVHLSQSPTSAKAQSILLPTSNDQIKGSRCKAQDPNLNYKPVIGILTHPGDGASGRLSKATNASNIPASYVKFVESGGARVIPILYNEPPLDIADKLTLVNGVLFTGGWAKKGPYFETAKWIFQKVLEKNDAGEHFPLFAVNLGFEIVTMIVSENNDILERFGSKNQASTLQFVENTGFEGTLFGKFPPQLIEKLSTECLVMQNHRYGISPQRFQETTALSNFFKILTTSKDENNKVYVSTAQALKYPITASQWLPQKNAFEWAAYAMIPHSEDAIEVTQQTVNYFIREARKSSKRSAPGQILKNLIYNYAPTYGGYAGKGYDEVYIFS